MNVLFIGRSVFHFSYYQSLIQELCKNDNEVTLLFDEQWSLNQPRAALDQFMNQKVVNVKLDFSIRREKGAKRNFIFAARELRSYISYLRRPEQSDFYLKRWESYLAHSLRAIVMFPLMKAIFSTSVLARLMAWIEKIVNPSVKVTEHLQSLSPDVVVVSPGNMRFDEEIEYVKAAKKLNIPTALLVLSWDNLTTKGLIHIKPDLLMCWNDEHAVEAQKVHGIAKNNIFQIGSTFFDKWFQIDDDNYEQERFCKRVGLDVGKDYFVYLGSSSNIAKDETWLVEEIYNAMKSSNDPQVRNAQLLVRPHPANADNYLRLEHYEDIVVWPKVGTLPESKVSQDDFINTIIHSVAGVGINTSGMIDNIILGKPCLAIMVPEYAKTQDQAIHFSHLYNSGALDIVENVPSCINVFSELIAGNDHKKEAREGFITSFIRPYGKQHSAGKVGALAVGKLAKEQNVTRKFKEELLDEIKGDKL